MTLEASIGTLIDEHDMTGLDQVLQQSSGQTEVAIAIMKALQERPDRISEVQLGLSVELAARRKHAEHHGTDPTGALVADFAARCLFVEQTDERLQSLASSLINLKKNESEHAHVDPTVLVQTWRQLKAPEYCRIIREDTDFRGGSPSMETSGSGREVLWQRAQRAINQRDYPLLLELLDQIDGAWGGLYMLNAAITMDLTLEAIGELYAGLRTAMIEDGRMKPPL